MTFGDLETRLLATVELGSNLSAAPYVERTVRRETVFTFASGEEVYELTSPGGAVYVMQSVSQIIDPDLSLADLPTLGARLSPPNGWTYQSRTLDSDLIVVADGEATVVQDNLSNTYQRR